MLEGLWRWRSSLLCPPVSDHVTGTSSIKSPFCPHCPMGSARSKVQDKHKAHKVAASIPRHTPFSFKENHFGLILCHHDVHVFVAVASR